MEVGTLYMLSALLGAATGSFINVVALRYGKRSWTRSRSSCSSCGNVLRWFELVPVLSYLAQRARCRTCKTRLAVRYVLVELVAAVVFVGVAHSTLSGGELTLTLLVDFIVNAFVWSVLLLIALYDFDTTYIPNEFVYTFAFSGLAAHVLALGGELSLTHVLAGPLLYAPFYALWRYSEGKWLGLGDGKLAWGMGWYLGLAGGLSAVVFGFWAGAAVGLAIIAYGKLRERIGAHSGWWLFAKRGRGLTMKSEVPFGPFLILGTALVYFYDLSAFSLFS